MRRSYISPEFDYNRVFGTLNMKEESSFFGSKRLEIEDFLEVHNQGIVYFQNLLNEQLDLDVEKTSSPIIYLASDDKKLNHTLVLDDSQNDFQKNGLTRRRLWTRRAAALYVCGSVDCFAATAHRGGGRAALMRLPL